VTKRMQVSALPRPQGKWADRRPFVAGIQTPARSAVPAVPAVPASMLVVQRPLDARAGK